MSDEILKDILAKLESMDNKIVSMDKKLDGLSEDMQLVKRAVLETSDSVNRIEANQERHERVLDVLSVRSIEQESEIKRLR